MRQLPSFILEWTDTKGCRHFAAEKGRLARVVTIARKKAKETGHPVIIKNRRMNVERTIEP